MFRLDIQGLRALAVGSVVIEHAFPSALSGGYVGVDIFFVISGFLISSIVARDIDRSQFSIIDFYRRRTRRIAPALVTVLLVTLFSGAVVLDPQAYKELAKTTLSTLLFVSNFFFARLSGYFDGNSMYKPLLHMWSLAVEEQFYIFFPPFMAFLWKRIGPSGTRQVIIVVAISSLIAAETMRNYSATAAYYMLPSRAFELLVGVMFGLGLVPSLRNAALRHMASLLGLAMIFFTFVFFTPATPMPGLAALIPCLGAILVIHAGSPSKDGKFVQSFGGRILSLQPLVYIGAISYSLYLWHWPVMALIRSVMGTQLSLSLGLLTIMISGVAAILSYHFIEKPFLAYSRRLWPIMLICATGAGMVGVLSVAIFVLGGLPQRFSLSSQQLFAAASDYNSRRSECHWNGSDEIIPYEKSCTFGKSDVQPDIAVWGDSHGAELVVYIGERTAVLGRSVRQLTSSACPPALGVKLRERPLCAMGNERTLDAIIGDQAIRTVILTMNSYIYPDKATLESGLNETVRALKMANKAVYLIKQIPTMPFDPPARAGISAQFGLPLESLAIDFANVPREGG